MTALRYPWAERLHAMTRPPLPNVPLWRLNRFCAVANWIVEDYAWELDREGWQPAHMFRVPVDSDRRGGLCWYWTLGVTSIARIAGRHLVARAAGRYFAYERQKDGAAPLLCGEARRAVLGKMGYGA